MEHTIMLFSLIATIAGDESSATYTFEMLISKWRSEEPAPTFGFYTSSINWSSCGILASAYKSGGWREPCGHLAKFDNYH
ncbi:hypothetical protein BJ875DRAFT_459100 [Amylocarpus encephaloides]|uniref:Uncharacterized protein n=1 Tax=Amylocarpus encephaloides TaxID=45428 RepID=A0A9P8C6K3_9HELO|nr:hypothetical protein BJ875DRAFT_459100 [Amylocarpus encephaloides]